MISRRVVSRLQGGKLFVSELVGGQWESLNDGEGAEKTAFCPHHGKTPPAGVFSPPHRFLLPLTSQSRSSVRYGAPPRMRSDNDSSVRPTGRKRRFVLVERLIPSSCATDGAPARPENVSASR
jgi:hypothetical protein